MHPQEMNHWPWTWRAWGKVKYGLTARVLGDTGPHMLMVIAMDVVMLEHFDLQSVSLVVAKPPNDGNYFQGI